MKTFVYLLMALIVVVSGSGASVWADALTNEERLQALEQEVAILKRQIENDKEASTTKSATTPVVTANAKDGFQIKAQDDSFKLKVGGYAQADARFFGGNKKDPTSPVDTFVARTIRLVISGTVAERFDFYIAPEFGGTSTTSNLVTIPDSYVDWRLADAFKVRAGKFKAPFAYERLQSTPASTFAEPGLVETLAPNRDIGVQLFGDLLKGSVSYALSLTNGVTDGGTSVTDTNNDKELGARLFTQPFKNTDLLALRGFGFGGAVSYGHREDTTLPTYKTAGQTTFFTLAGTTYDGPQLRYSPQVAYYYHSLGLYGEYIASEAKLTKTAKRQRVSNDGWEAAASYVLTGEDASYKGIVPLRPFNAAKGQFGALELTGRYSTVDFDDKIFDSTVSSNVLASSPTEARAWTAGFNWYLTGNTKLVFNWEKTTYKGGATGNVNRTPEDLYLTRLQFAF